LPSSLVDTLSLSLADVKADAIMLFPVPEAGTFVVFQTLVAKAGVGVEKTPFVPMDMIAS